MLKKTKAKRVKENPGTIGGFWKLADEAVSEYQKNIKSAKKKKDSLALLLELEAQVNASQIPDFVSENFITPYLTPEKDKVTVVFDGLDGKGFADWLILFDKEKKHLKLNTVSIVAYSKSLLGSDEDLAKLDKVENFTEFRLLSFKKELAKMPQQYHMFLALLKGVADATSICISDSKSPAAVKQDDHCAFYTTTLWAFKQFEEFYQKFQNRSIRADYYMIWHEGEWIEP